MAKPLRDVAPKGVKKSKTEPADISDLVPDSASGNVDFAKKHKIEKHEDRAGNGDEVYNGKTKQVDMNKHGYKSPADQKVYEASMKCESCGKMYEGESCGCGSKVPQAGNGKRGMLADKKKLDENAEQIDELEQETMKSYVKKAGADKRDSEMKSKVYGSLANTLDSQSPKEASEVRAKGHEYYANAKKRGEGIKLAKKKLDEVLTKKTPVSNVIDGFVHSKNKMFKGDSKKQRIKRALGAFYDKHPEKSKNEEVEYVTEGGMPSSVIKSKQNRANMTDKEFADVHQDKSDADLRSMAWRHGYGKPGTPGHDHYVNRRAKGLKEDLAMPMLEGGKKKKTKKESGEDTPMRFPSGDVGDTGRV
jgi:hypothetical protein